MTKAQQSFGRDIQALFDGGTIGELTDRQLLERIKTPGDETAELAFAVLVERHGPMVFHACRSILGNRHAAEDAFQATFLVLSRKAGTLRLRDSLGPWLYSVACRVAWSARTAAARRRTHEHRAAELSTAIVDDPSQDDRDAVLYEELNRLPERYRLAVMICDLEGLTQEQAARRLGWPAGTVRSRLTRGRGRLRDRLTRRGLAPAIVPLGVSLARPAVPASVAAATVETAVGFGVAPSVTGTAAIALTEGVIKIMFLSKLKLVLAVVLTSGALVGATALLGHRAMGLSQPAPGKAKPQANSQVGPLAKAKLSAMAGIAEERLRVAKKVRDAMYQRFTGGQLGAEEYLVWQKRYDDLAYIVMTMTGGDRRRLCENRLAELKHVEQRMKSLFDIGQVQQSDIDIIQYYRLEAEEALAIAKAEDEGIPSN